MTRSWRLLVALLAALTCVPGSANTVRLDDSLSHTVPPNVKMQWLPFARGESNSGGMEAWVTVNIRIDTRDWIGRQGHIYMVLPRDEVSSIEAVWISQGRLQGGRLVSGDRALVFSGTIPGPTLEDQLRVRLRSNADWTSNTRRLNFHFELDTR